MYLEVSRSTVLAAWLIAGCVPRGLEVKPPALLDKLVGDYTQQKQRSARRYPKSIGVWRTQQTSAMSHRIYIIASRREISRLTLARQHDASSSMFFTSALASHMLQQLRTYEQLARTSCRLQDSPSLENGFQFNLRGMRCGNGGGSDFTTMILRWTVVNRT